MAYYSGSANNLAALKDALFNACVGEGWVLTGDILSKGEMYLRVQVASDYLTFLGGTGVAAGALTGAALNVVKIGGPGGSATAIVFPITYEIFVFAAEVYLVINHSVDIYLWAAFGKSTVQGLPGSGMWIGATCAGDVLNTPVPLGISADGYNAGYTSAALFWSQYVTSEYSRNYLVQHGLTSTDAWYLGLSPVDNAVGAFVTVPLIGLLPNTWNSEAVLLPLRCYAKRASDKISLVADLEHARCTRIDHYAPGQVVTLGSDKWKTFPWYRKNVASRNGGTAINHTGTFGWAIRYEGP